MGRFARLKVAGLVVVLLVVQTSFGADLRVLGVAPDLAVVVVICAAVNGGAEAGAWVGFWVGLAADLISVSTPVGLYALTYSLVGAGIGASRTYFVGEARGLPPLAALVGTALAVLAFVGLGDILGQHQLLAGGRSWLIKVAVVESCWSAVLAWPVNRLYRWAARGALGVAAAGSRPSGVRIPG